MEGKRGIQQWLLTHTNRKQRQDSLHTAWLIEDAEMNASRARKTCMELLRKVLSSECNVHLKTHAPCAKRWLPAALEVLSKNNIDPISFARQVMNTLTKGRGKGSNFFIVRPANRAKSFMLMPLSIMFDCFFCPSNFKFNFVTAIDKEIISSTICGMVLMTRGMRNFYHGIKS